MQGEMRRARTQGGKRGARTQGEERVARTQGEKRGARMQHVKRGDRMQREKRGARTQTIPHDNYLLTASEEKHVAQQRFIGVCNAGTEERGVVRQ